MKDHITPRERLRDSEKELNIVFVLLLALLIVSCVLVVCLQGNVS